MTTKSYSKHKEYKEFSSSRGTVPYTEEQFDMIKSDLLPKGSKLETLGGGGGAREYHYEYREEKHPSGKYDRKDLHTVEEFTIPPKGIPKSSDSSSYYYEREERELPAITMGTRTYNYETTGTSPGYSKVKTAKVTKEMTQNVEELDSLLDDLQKDQERQLYKSGYTSDTAESTSFDYRRGTPAKAPSSGYSTLKHEERVESSSWGSSPPPTVTRAAEVRQELYREETTESRVIPAQVSPAAPPALCAHCHHPPSTGTLPRAGTPMNKVTTTVKTYTYEVPADQDPTAVPLPPLADHQHTYVSSAETLRATSPAPGLGPAGSPAGSVGAPAGVPVGSPPGCQYCSHCSSRLHYRTVTTTDEHTNERMLYPGSPGFPGGAGGAGGERPLPAEPLNGHGPYGPTSYKYSETYSSHNTTRFPNNTTLHPTPAGAPLPSRGASPSPAPSPSPFPRPHTPSHAQQTPKRLDDLLADFPEARFPTQPDGVVRRKVEVTHENSTQSGRHDTTGKDKPGPVVLPSKNVAGPAVYYPPGHTPFAKKPESAAYQASAMQGGGAYASGRGMYEYESGSRSKEKHSEKKTAVPICLPLCCAMPCVIM